MKFNAKITDYYIYLNTKPVISFEDLLRFEQPVAIVKDITLKLSLKSNNNTTDNSYNLGCNDIPNGFQCVDPELFIVIGEILGNIIAGSIPFNVQNALGNWLELVGQAILTYNSQQQYFQGGPGRYFNPANYNITNPFCSTNATNTTQSANSNSTNKNSSKIKENNSAMEHNKCNQNENNKIEELELRINKLMSEIEKIKDIIKK